MLTRTITLIPGESFTLPPNSTVMGVSGSLISTCGTLPEPESLSCYGILYGLSSGEQSIHETNENVIIKGFRINNIEHLFGTSYTHNAGSVLLTDTISTRIAANPYLSGIITEVCSTRYANSGPRGGMYVISFKSSPSLMVNAQIIMEQEAAPYTGSAPTKILVPIRPRADLLIDGFPNDTCVCINNSL